MKPLVVSLPALPAAILAAYFLAASAAAQAPPTGATGSPPPPMHAAPTHLQVLSKNLSADQVHEIMGEWGLELGVHCSACHTAPKNPDASGHLHPDFTDASKPEHEATRAMVRMTQEINEKYLPKMGAGAAPMTCGTCHRGHLVPEPYVTPQPEPRPEPGQSQQPSGSMPPQGR